VKNDKIVLYFSKDFFLNARWRERLHVLLTEAVAHPETGGWTRQCKWGRSHQQNRGQGDPNEQDPHGCAVDDEAEDVAVDEEVHDGAVEDKVRTVDEVDRGGSPDFLS